MKPWWIILVAVLTIGSCGEPRKQDPKTAETPTLSEADPKAQDDAAVSLDELVYEAEGRSTIKAESAARSQAELKGRAGLLKSLEADAGVLIGGFMEANKSLFKGDATPDAWVTALRRHFNAESFTLKGSVAAEFEKSESGDTLIATMNLPLMTGYEVIEGALTDIAISNEWMAAAKTDEFKKAFREYYLTEKKKLLTTPS